MQKDTRNLTVAQEHLRTAMQEVTLAQGQSEQSMARASAERAMRNMDLVVRRLETERGRLARTSLETELEAAFASAQRAWQGLHDVLNDWEYASQAGLGQVRDDLAAAEQRVTSICDKAPQEAMHP